MTRKDRLKLAYHLDKVDFGLGDLQWNIFVIIRNTGDLRRAHNLRYQNALCCKHSEKKAFPSRHVEICNDKRKHDGKIWSCLLTRTVSGRAWVSPKKTPFREKVRVLAKINSKAVIDTLTEKVRVLAFPCIVLRTIKNKQWIFKMPSSWDDPRIPRERCMGIDIEKSWHAHRV